MGWLDRFPGRKPQGDSKADPAALARVSPGEARVPVATGRGWKYESRHLIFGVFLAGNEIARVYTRAGARIIGREAVYVPALLRALPAPSARPRG